MNHLRTILLAALLFPAAPAAGQTIKSLGFNTTNGQVVYSGTNPLTFTNSLQFATNARAATRTNLGGTTVGDSVFTATNQTAAQAAIFGTNAEIKNSSGIVALSLSGGETKLLSPISFPYINGSAAAATSRTNLGLGTTWLTNTDVTNFRTAIGLGTAATNPSTAFQPSSANLTNLAANNGGSLTNLTAANIVGTVGLASNITGTAPLASNVTGVVAIANGGTGANNATNARTNLGLGATWLTNTDVTNFRTAIGLGATNNVTFGAVNLNSGSDTGVLRFTNTASGVEVVVAGSPRASFGPTTSSIGGTLIASNLTASGTLAVSNAATFATNVTVNGALSVGSLTTTTPSTWALDATQTAAATNGILALPSNANVIRLTNNNPISGVSGGVLGAFYYLINQTTNAVTISNVGGITVQGGTPLTLGAGQAATLVATGATNASVAARGDLNDVTLGGTLNIAPAQTTNSADSLMTRSLSDTRYGEWISQTEMDQLEFTTATVSSTTLGGSYSAENTNILYGSVLRMYAFTNTGDYNVVNVNSASLAFVNSANVAGQGQGMGLYVRAFAGVGTNRVARIIYGGVSSNQVAGIVGTNGIDRRGFALEIAPTAGGVSNNLRLIAQDGTNGNVASAWVTVAAGSLACSYFMAHSSNATRVYYGIDNSRPSRTPVITLNHTFAAGTGPGAPTGILFSVVNTNNDTSAGTLFIRGAWQMLNADLVGY